MLAKRCGFSAYSRRDTLLKILVVLLLSAGVADLGFLNLTIAPRIFVKERGPMGIAGRTALLGMDSPEKLPPTDEEDRKYDIPAEEIAPPVAGPVGDNIKAAEPDDDSLDLPTEGPSEVLFRTSSAAVTKRAERILEEALEYLTINPKITLLIKGHSDIRGSSEINNLLSFRRAKSAKNWLVDHGAPMDRIRIKGLGARYPSALVGTVEAFFSKNRRVELIWQ